VVKEASHIRPEIDEFQKRPDTRSYLAPWQALTSLDGLAQRSRAYIQRGRKLQPGGGAEGSCGCPGIAYNGSLLPSCGIESSSALV
jgi:hypothetical protein